MGILASIPCALSREEINEIAFAIDVHSVSSLRSSKRNLRQCRSVSIIESNLLFTNFLFSQFEKSKCLESGGLCSSLLLSHSKRKRGPYVHELCIQSSFKTRVKELKLHDLIFNLAVASCWCEVIPANLSSCNKAKFDNSSSHS